MQAEQGKLQREELGGQRGLTLKLQSWRPLLYLMVKVLSTFCTQVAFGRCCTSPVLGWQDSKNGRVCPAVTRTLIPLESPSGQRTWVLEERSWLQHHMARKMPLEANQLPHKASGISALPGSCLQLVPAARLGWHTAARQQLHRNIYAPVIPSAPSTGLVEVE